LSQNIALAFITARAATALKALVPPIQELLNVKNYSAKVFIGGGNGAVLYEIKGSGLLEIYNYGLNQAEINRAVTVWAEIYKKCDIADDDLNPAGIATFQNFLNESWQGYISDEALDVSRRHKGKIFTEAAKVTFVLPLDKEKRNSMISGVGQLLGLDYAVVAGDDKFAHITKRLEADNKAIAINTLLGRLKLTASQAATFGDMPLDNDAGLLSFPFSFTNSAEFVKIKANSAMPPFILTADNSNLIGSVYQTISFLIS